MLFRLYGQQKLVLYWNLGIVFYAVGECDNNVGLADISNTIGVVSRLQYPHF